VIIGDLLGCGTSTCVAADAEEAYCVVHHSCAAVTISVAYEIGHLPGVRQECRIDGSGSLHALWRSYVNGCKWRTMTSRRQNCDGCLCIRWRTYPRGR
jgi:hypothetical protein